MSGFSGDYYELELDSIHLNGLPMPSRTILLPRVTKILDALPKYLQWWGYRMGLLEGRRLADVDTLALDEHSFYEHVKKMGREGEATTPSNSLEDAGSRGLIVHDVAEMFFKHRKIPSPDEIPTEYHGYVKALASWWKSIPDDVEVVQTESTLYSLLHGYAGTTDLILKHGDFYQVIDFKTSKAIYDSALIQIAAYVEAAREMGLTGILTAGTVVRLGASGKYHTKDSPCTIEDFLVVKKQWELLERLKGGEDGRTTSLDIVRDGGGPGSTRVSEIAGPAPEGRSLVSAD